MGDVSYAQATRHATNRRRAGNPQHPLGCRTNGFGCGRAASNRKRPVAPTTVATMLKLMREKGLVERRDGPRGYLWSAKISRRTSRAGLLSSLLHPDEPAMRLSLATIGLAAALLFVPFMLAVACAPQSDRPAAGTSHARGNRPGRRKHGPACTTISPHEAPAPAIRCFESGGGEAAQWPGRSAVEAWPCPGNDSDRRCRHSQK